MTINQVFEQSIKAIKTQPMYAGQFYSPEGVVAIIRDIQSKVVGNETAGEPGQLLITHNMRDRLEEMINDQITEAIDGLNSSDVIDSTSIEMSINGSHATIDNVDIDTSILYDEISYHTDGTVTEWMNEFNIRYAE